MSMKKTLVVLGLVLASGTALAGELGDFCITGLSMGKTIATDCSITEELDGKTYCFGNEEAKATFNADQVSVLKKAESFYNTLQFGGNCTTGLSLGKVVQTDCSIKVNRDGKVYCFGNQEALATYKKAPKSTIEKANKFYADNPVQ